MSAPRTRPPQLHLQLLHRSVRPVVAGLDQQAVRQALAALLLSTIRNNNDGDAHEIAPASEGQRDRIHR